MQSICKSFLQFNEAQEIINRARKRECPVAVGGLSAIHKAHCIAAVRSELNRPIVVLCPDENEAGKIASDISAFIGEKVASLNGRDFTFYPVESVSRGGEHARLSILHSMLHSNSVVCGTIDAFIQRTLPPDVLRNQAISIRARQEIPVKQLIQTLIQNGYKRAMQVEGTGQFAVRGGIVDIFSPMHQNAFRIEYFGDEIDTLSYIDVTTQRRTENVTEVVILPCSETLPHTAECGFDELCNMVEKLNKDDALRLKETDSLPDIDKYMQLISPTCYTALDYLPKNVIVFMIEQSRLTERLDNSLWQRHQDIEHLLEQKRLTSKTSKLGIEADDLWCLLSKLDVMMLDSFIPSSFALRPHSILNIQAKQLPSFGMSLDTAIGDISHYFRQNYTTAVFVTNERRAKNLEEMLRERNLPSVITNDMHTGQINICISSISAGIEYPMLQLAILTEGQITIDKKKKRVSSIKDSSRKRIASYTDLTPGDLVVHEHHGIGRFVGISPMAVDGIHRDYIKIAYAGTDSLYVPVTQLNLVSKYIGAGGEPTDTKPHKLSKLGGTEWKASKSRAKSAAKELAKGLIELYAARKRKQGFAFPEDCDWQMSFEESFPYDETDDQLRCIQEIKADMQQVCPMDRLLCGDVGFGKTEVALRAVMKCIMGGKQSAILVPTTVLAQQHYQTAIQRFSGFPVKIAVLSRFRTPAQVKESVSKLKQGKLDLIIGTHRLLQKDIQFKNLGLVIIDEEQRFGVTHKEKLKEISQMVDSLTLTATPIPRTLNMALSGIRDMSTIEEAPRDRYPVQTFVLEHDWSLIADAIRREVSRGGQVYYLHNRVETIDNVASQILALLPDITIAVGHGQMKEHELSEVMRKTTEGQAQVLICTTIIETGIDIPNVNTLIVEDADRMGLSQLHQLRGRVGRSSRHSYAYLTYKKGKILSEISTKRLSAIREFAEFGSGFKIAMRDLEIRGAGNVLGSQQSGHMMSVGYDMYIKLLEEAVIEERGETASAMIECTVDIIISASIPEKYISHAGIRMDIYRTIAAVSTEGQAQDVIDELIDRFGDVPDSVNTLVQIALLRSTAGSVGICEISQKDERLHIRMAVPDFSQIAKLCSLPQYKGRILFSAGDTPYISIKLAKNEHIIKTAFEFVQAMVDIT